MEGPLTELRNQRLPRRKMAQTYGKKKTSGASATHRNLFGSDENEIENQLAQLSLETPEESPTPPKTAIKTSQRISVRSAATKQTAVVRRSALITEEDAAAIEPLLALSESGVDRFTTFGSKLAKSFDIQKIGEGSFAEVFKLTPNAEGTNAHRSKTPHSVLTGGAIIKVIPLQTASSTIEVVDRLSSVASVAREIKVLRTLDSIHGFTRFRGIRLVTGVWPRSFLDAFRVFRRAHRKRAINAAPDDDFDDLQIYALVEMDDAGIEISMIKRPSAFQVYDVFWMTVVLLANAEEQVEFEHRDLHLSNICIKPAQTAAVVKEDDENDNNARGGSGTAGPILDIDPSVLAEMTSSNTPAVKLGLSNLKITIIDYTVTRCNLATPPSSSSTSDPAAPPTDPEIAYDPMLFLASPSPSSSPAADQDAESNLQMQTYQKTKAAVTYAAHRTTGVTTDDKWKQFVPRTNVVWLAYLLRSLSRRAKGRCKKYYVVKGSSRAAKEVQEEMWDRLAVVEDVVAGVDPNEDDDDDSRTKGEHGETGISDEEIERTPASARELLGRAVEEGWLTKEEIDAVKARLEAEL